MKRFLKFLMLILAFSILEGSFAWSQTNLLPQLNQAFIQFITYEEAIEVVKLKSLQDEKGVSEIKSKIAHDFGISFFEIEMEHERLFELFASTPLYKVWKENSELIIYDALQRLGLTRLDQKRRDKFLEESLSILHQHPSQLNQTPEFRKRSAFDTFNSGVQWLFVGKNSSASDNEIRALITLERIRDRRSFEALLNVGYKQTHRYDSDVQRKAKDILWSLLNLWTPSQLDELLKVVDTSEREKVLEAKNHFDPSVPEGTNYISANYVGMSEGIISSPIDMGKGLVQNAMVPTRLIGGIIGAFISGITHIPSEVAGLATGGAYGASNHSLGQELFVTAMIALPTIKAVKGAYRNGNLYTQKMRSQGRGETISLSGNSPSFKYRPQENFLPPDLSVPKSWGKPSETFNLSSSLNSERLNSSPQGPQPQGPQAQLQALPKTFTLPEFQLGQLNFTLEPQQPSTALMPAPLWVHPGSLKSNNVMDKNFANTGLTQDPQNFYWIAVSLLNSGTYLPKDNHKKRVLIIRKNSQNEVTGFFYQEVDNETDIQTLKTSIYDDVYSTGPSSNQPQGDTVMASADHSGNSASGLGGTENHDNKTDRDKAPTDREFYDQIEKSEDYHGGDIETTFHKFKTSDGQTSYEFLRNAVPDLRGKTVVDLAGGSGALSKILVDAVGPDGKVILVDFNEKELSLAQKKISGENIEFLLNSAQDLSSIPSSSVDVVFCSLGLMLFRPLLPVVSEIFRIMKPGGILSAIVLPNDLFNTHYPIFNEYLEVAAQYDSAELELNKWGWGDLGADNVTGIRNFFNKASGFSSDIKVDEFTLEFKDTSENLLIQLRGFFQTSYLLNDKKLQREYEMKLLQVLEKHKSSNGLTLFQMPFVRVTIKKNQENKPIDEELKGVVGSGSAQEPDPLDKIDIHAIHSIHDLFPPDVKLLERPLRIVSLGTGILPVWEKVLEEQFGVHVTGIEIEPNKFEGTPIATQLQGGMHFGTDYEAFTPELLFDILILNYPNPGSLSDADAFFLVDSSIVSPDQLLEQWLEKKAALIRKYVRPNGIAVLVTELANMNARINPAAIFSKTFGKNNVHVYPNITDYDSLGLSNEEILQRTPYVGSSIKYDMLNSDLLGHFYVIRNANPNEGASEITPVQQCMAAIANPRESMQGREHYIHTLRNIGSDEAIAALITLLDDSDLADSAAVALSKVNPSKVIPMLLKMDATQHQNAGSILMALNLIGGRLNPKDPRRAWISKFVRENSTIKQDAGVALQAQPDESSYVHTYQVYFDKAVESQDLAEQKRAIEYLQKQGTEFVPVLDDILRTDTRIEARLLAVRLLTLFTTYDSVQSLIRAVISPDSQPLVVRRMALDILVSAIKPEAGTEIRQLIDQLENDAEVASLNRAKSNPSNPKDMLIIAEFTEKMKKIKDFIPPETEETLPMLSLGSAQEHAAWDEYAAEHEALSGASNDAAIVQLILEKLNKPNSLLFQQFIIQAGPVLLPALFDILEMREQNIAKQKIYSILSEMGTSTLPPITAFLNSPQGQALSSDVTEKLHEIIQNLGSK